MWMRTASGVEIPRVPKAGYQRHQHKYIQRFWNVARQDWEYVYPTEVTAPSGMNGYSGDVEANAMTRRSNDRHQGDKEQELADQMDALKPGSKRDVPPEDLDKKDETEQFLEGFEEGYKLGKDVEEQVEKSLRMPSKYIAVPYPSEDPDDKEGKYLHTCDRHDTFVATGHKNREYTPEFCEHCAHEWGREGRGAPYAGTLEHGNPADFGEANKNGSCKKCGFRAVMKSLVIVRARKVN